MANNYYDATGTLAFDGEPNITPIIRALFAAFDLDITYPGDGKVYIAAISEGNNPDWDSIATCISNEKESLGITTADDDDEDDIKYWILALAEKFGVADDPTFIHFIENEDFESGSPDLNDLFMLANLFDDGHNLKAIGMEAAYTCSKPRLYEFGGVGQYTGRHIKFVTTSSKAIILGEQLNDALASGDIAKAGELIGVETIHMLNSVMAHTMRKEIAEIVAKHLQSIAP